MGSSVLTAVVSRRVRPSRAVTPLLACVVLAMASMSVARAVTVPATAPSPAGLPPAAASPGVAAATAPTSATTATALTGAASSVAAAASPVATDSPVAVTPSASHALTVPAVTLPATSMTASDYLYRGTGQKPLQWKCGEHKLYVRGFPSTWTALITAKVKELNTAIPRLTWKVVIGTVPAGSEAVIEYRSFGSPVRGLTQHTITPDLFKTVVVSINKDLVLSPTAAASGITIMHELAHAAGLDHRDTDPDSATTRRPRAGTGPYTGKLSPGDRVAFLVEGCAL